MVAEPGLLNDRTGLAEIKVVYGSSDPYGSDGD